MAKKPAKPKQLKESRRAASNARRKDGPSSKRQPLNPKQVSPAVAGTLPLSGESQSAFTPGTVNIGDSRRSELPSSRIEVVERGLGGKRWRVQAWNARDWKYEASLFFDTEAEARETAQMLAKMPYKDAVTAMLAKAPNYSNLRMPE